MTYVGGARLKSEPTISMTIYNAPVDGITWQAVEDFLVQNVKEGAYLDYKVDWPKELERTIAGMANTFGGVILIGVDQNTGWQSQ
jgi:hypothetical protein